MPLRPRPPRSFYRGSAIHTNGPTTRGSFLNDAPKRFCTAEEKAGALLRQAIGKLHLSARAYHRVLKLSRTIADLAGEATIGVTHVAEAIQYRRLERSF